MDDKTHYIWVYPLKTKDEVFERFLEWKALVENVSGKKLKRLRTDNGGEYTSKRFEGYLKSCGIQHEKTIPKTPEQNGVAERLNRTLVESVRSMLLDAGLPQKYWAEAVATAAYLRNRCPTTAVKEMTPFEAWFGRKPKVGHLRVFGCEAHAHIPKDERGKFDSKTRKCILVGYGELRKGYRLYNVDRRTILYSRDVHFNEVEKETTPVVENEGDRYILVDLPHGPDPEVSDDKQEEIAEAIPAPRRSTRVRRHYRPFESTSLSIHVEPKSFEEATTSPEKAKWFEAMEREMESLKHHDVWELVNLPPGKKIIGSKWVFKVKTNADGSIERYKARLVAQGYSQKLGADYDETFCPVVRQESLRLLLAMSVQQGMKLHHVDVNTAFLNGTLEEEVYIQQPKGFVKEREQNLVCKLKKSLYGLKQSPRCWNATLDAHLKSMGFTQSTADPCIYTSHTGGEVFHIGVYVDDIVLAGANEDHIKLVKSELSSKFDIKDLGELKYFLGITVIQDKEQGLAWIGQPAYVKSLLEKFDMSDCKPVATPVDVSSKLVKATDDEVSVDQQLYQSAVGSLMYLSVCSRPDIAYAVNTLAKFSSKPTQTHWTAVKRVLRYLKGTAEYGILFKNEESKECIGYSDADWAGDHDDRKSTSGYIFKSASGAISWRSKKQECVALSTAEAEYVALSSATQEAVWLRKLATDLGNPPKEPTTVFEDNQSAIAMSKNPQFHGRAKHIDIKHHYVREQVNRGTVKLEYCSTREMTADMFTKGLNREQFCRLREKAGVMHMDICVQVDK